MEDEKSLIRKKTGRTFLIFQFRAPHDIIGVMGLGSLSEWIHLQYGTVQQSITEGTQRSEWMEQSVDSEHSLIGIWMKPCKSLPR